MNKYKDRMQFVNLNSQLIFRKLLPYPSICEAGRMRWTIENQGFNTQKNGGYHLGHKFSRKSFNSYQNYYQCMQIAHIINMLIEHSSNIAGLLKNDTKLTIKHIWKQLIGTLTYIVINETDFVTEQRCQIRLAG